MLMEMSFDKWADIIASKNILPHKIVCLIQTRYYEEYFSYVKNVGADSNWNDGNGIAIKNGALDLFYMPIIKKTIINGVKAASGTVLIIADYGMEESAYLFGVDAAAFMNLMSSMADTATLENFINISNKCITKLDYKIDSSGELSENMMMLF